MSKFYIKQIAVTGEKVLFSEVSFNDGVNIIYGPSNAGKSYIINCINFMFAGDPPFTKSSTGYDTVTMKMESDDGYAISMTRKIIDGKNGEVDENSVEVISNYPRVESGAYSISKNEYSDLLLELMGINEHQGTASSENRELMRDRYELSTKIEEALFLKDRYCVLKSQYEADILRLQFICDGERKEDTIDEVVACTFCNHEIEKGTAAHESYIESAAIEIQRIQLQINDLISAESDVCEGIEKYERELQELDDQITAITNSINAELKPRATELNTDVFEKENEEDGESAKFKGGELINKDAWKTLSDNLNSMIKECGYPNAPESRLSIDTLDVVVGGKFKKDQGKGYRAYLNTIMLFNLMKYLEEKAIYAPHLLILDSPILSLKEKKHKISEKEKATPGMRESLFKYVVNHCGNNQVIIAENEIPEGVDYSSVKLIEYTTDESEGTYGFLKSVKN